MRRTWGVGYRDRVDVSRGPVGQAAPLTRHEREQVLESVPCRIYQSDNRAINMTQTAADIQQQDKLACAPDVDIRAGDELLIHRGAGLGKSGPTIRAFAADPNLYYEPFGAVIPGLAHQEIRLLHQERVK